MSEQNVPAAGGKGTTVQELVQVREQLRGWIARLDEMRDQAPGRVAERVRADYEERLRRVTEELSSHRDEIERDLLRLRDELAGAESRRLQSTDAMEEVRLRHLIGELDEAAWEEQRPRLEGDLAAAEEALARARAEVERLEALATEVAGGAAVDVPGPEAPAPEPVAEAPAPVEEAGAPPAEPEHPSAPLSGAAGADDPSVDNWDPFGGELGGPTALSGDAADDLPWLEDLETGGKEWSQAAAADEDGLAFLKEIEGNAAARQEESGELGADDLAFLEELDRAISGSPGAPPKPAAPPPGDGAPAAPAEGAPPATPPAQPAGGGPRAEPLLCKECGAINEPHSWYCEICGSEL